MREGSYDKSLVKCRTILRSATALKDNYIIASTYNTIGGNFDLFSNPDKAYFYYKKGLIYVDRTNNLKLKNLLHNNLGNIYCFNKKEYKKGIGHYKQSLEYSQQVKDSSRLVLTNLNIAWAYFDINEFDKGFPHLQFTNPHHEKHGGDLTIVTLKMLNAIYYGVKKEHSKAESYFAEAIKIGNTSNEKFDLALTLQEYAKYLNSVQKYKEAFEHLATYNSITDELNIEDKLNTAKNEGLNLEIEEYKRKVEKIESEFKSQQVLLAQEKVIARRKLITIILIFLISIVLFYFYL